MIRILLAAALMAASPWALSQALNPQVVKNGPSENELDRKLGEISDLATLQQLVLKYQGAQDRDSEGRVLRRLTQIRPHLGAYKYELAASYAARDEKSLAYNALLELQAEGYAFDPRQDKRFTPVATTEAWEYILKALDENRKPFGEGRVLATLPKDDLLIESVAWDPTRKQALVGSAREGAVYAVDAKGGLQPLVVADKDNGMWAVFDLAVDAERGVLWVASTAVPHYKRYNAETDLGRAGLFKFDLKTGKFIKRFLSPVAIGQSFFMSTLALAPDGTVYAADGVNNAVYSVAADQLKRVFHAPVLGSIRGLAVSGNGKTLYFADFERGLFGFDLAAGKPFEVGVPPKLALGGIDGVVWWRNQLAIVQNGMNPSRIMRLKLTDDGRAIAGVQPLEANKPELAQPTLATRDGDRLIFIANSQKNKYDRFGLPRDPAALEGTRLYAVDLKFGETEAAKPD